MKPVVLVPNDATKPMVVKNCTFLACGGIVPTDLDKPIVIKNCRFVHTPDR